MSNDTPVSRRSLWPGLITLAAATVCAIIVAVPGHAGLSGRPITIYDHSRWVLLALAAVAGIGLLIRDRGPLAQGAATTGGVAFLQLMTTGLVAAQHWRPLVGMAGLATTDIPTLTLLAWALVAAAITATAACLVAARTLRIWRHGPPDAYRWIAMTLGLIVAVALPPVLGSGNAQNMDVRSLAAYTLLYALPWGATIAVSGWLTRIGSLTALITVAACATSAAASHSMLGIAHPTRGLLPTIAATVALAFSTQRRRTGT